MTLRVPGVPVPQLLAQPPIPLEASGPFSAGPFSAGPFSVGPSSAGPLLVFSAEASVAWAAHVEAALLASPRPEAFVAVDDHPAEAALVGQVGRGLARDDRAPDDCSAELPSDARCGPAGPLDDSSADGPFPADSAGRSWAVSQDDSFPGDCLVAAALVGSALPQAGDSSADDSSADGSPPTGSAGCLGARSTDDLPEDDRSVLAVGSDGSRPVDFGGL